MDQVAHIAKLPWWRKPFPVPASIRSFHIYICILLLQSIAQYLRLWRFEAEPELYFSASLTSFQRLMLLVMAHPALQLGLGIGALAAALIFIYSANYFRLLLAWGLATCFWTLDHVYLYAWRGGEVAFFVFVALPFLAFLYWQRSVSRLRSKAGQLAPPEPGADKNPYYLIAVFGISLCVSMSPYFEPHHLSNSEPFIGQRMINRRGAWLVEDFEFQGAKRPFPAKRIFFHRDGRCELEKPSRRTFGSFLARKDTAYIGCLGMGPTEFAYTLQADKLHLSAPAFSLTLRQDNWGPGYYDDIFPFLRR
jgi:hypothetical protein